MRKGLAVVGLFVTVSAIATIIVCFFLEIRREDLNGVVFGITTLALIAALVIFNTYLQGVDYPPEDSPYWTTDPGLMATFVVNVFLDILLLAAIGVSCGMTIYAASANGVLN